MASAYKRINNILSKSDITETSVNQSLLSDQYEIKLYEILQKITPVINKYYDEANYAEALAKLAELKDPVDQFFENVMVNSDDTAIKTNRIALLRNLHLIIGQTADISVLY